MRLLEIDQSRHLPARLNWAREMTFARVLQGERLLQLLLYDISRLGLQSEAVQLFNNFLDRENRREAEGAAAKQLHLGVLAVGKPDAAKQCREWLLPRRTESADDGVLY